MAAFEKGDWVWFNHPEETWIPAKVTEGGSGDITVEMDDGLEHTHAVSTGLFMPMDEANLAPADDMVKLGDLHDAAMLHNLRLRFYNDDIFTYIGPILVALNPYKRIPIFTPEFVTVRHMRTSFLCRTQCANNEAMCRNTTRNQLVLTWSLTFISWRTMHTLT